VKGAAVNAMALKLPTGRTLGGAQMSAFLKEKMRIDGIRAEAHAPDLGNQLVAQAGAGQSIKASATAKDEIREPDVISIPN
jgi:hypothetical protein